MSDAMDDLPAGNVDFLDNYLPGLKDADYQLTVSHALTFTSPTTGKQVADPDITIVDRVQRFTVAGPRFAIDASEIHAQFPPPGATGKFAEVLPHVVLNKRLLPWERDIVEDGTVPWVALLVFQEGELAGDPHDSQLVIANYASTVTVKDLLAQASSTVRVPTITVESDAEQAMQCKVITVSSATFAAVAPTHLELPLLAHVRKVDTGDKVSLDLKDDGLFSVVVANRFPQPGDGTAAAKNIVHLVSLEGFADLLSGTAPVTPTQAQVKLVSLASWTFSCFPDPSQTFSGLAKNLAYDANDVWRPASSLALRLPFTAVQSPNAPTAAAQLRLTDGYVALGYHAPTGEDGFAWYRGPLTPVVTNPLPTAAPFESSSAATIYDPDTGLFDLSLAAAWQCGRSLALTDQTFATTLMRVRQAAGTSLDLMAMKFVAAPVAPQQELQSDLATLFVAGIVDMLRQISTANLITPMPAVVRAQASAAPVHLLRTFIARPDVRATLSDSLDDSLDATAVAEWLGRLRLLIGVPFVNLVPDARMLPAESARFFYLDENWIGALIDGALHVGLGTSRESAVQLALTEKLEQMALAAALAWRAESIDAPAPSPADGPISGLLIRSALASGWPGLTVTGTATDGTSVPVLRIDHLAPGVLLCLFNGVPATVTLTEPHEGLAFGVNDKGMVATRTIATPKVTEGSEVCIYDPQANTVGLPTMRAGGTRVLNVNINTDYATQTSASDSPTDLLGTLAKTLSDDAKRAGGKGVGTAALHPALFAVQMVQGPDVLTFSKNPMPDPSLRSVT